MTYHLTDDDSTLWRGHPGDDGSQVIASRRTTDPEAWTLLLRGAGLDGETREPMRIESILASIKQRVRDETYKETHDPTKARDASERVASACRAELDELIRERVIKAATDYLKSEPRFVSEDPWLRVGRCTCAAASLGPGPHESCCGQIDDDYPALEVQR